MATKSPSTFPLGSAVMPRLILPMAKSLSMRNLCSFQRESACSCAKAKGAADISAVVATEMSALQMNERDNSMLTSAIAPLEILGQRASRAMVDFCVLVEGVATAIGPLRICCSHNICAATSNCCGSKHD